MKLLRSPTLTNLQGHKPYPRPEHPAFERRPCLRLVRTVIADTGSLQGAQESPRVLRRAEPCLGHWSWAWRDALGVQDLRNRVRAEKI